MEQTVEIGVPLERVQQRSAGKIEDVPQCPEETVDLVKLVSHECNSRPPRRSLRGISTRSASRSVQIVDVPVPQILEKLVSQERVQQRTAEQIDEDSPQSPEKTVDAVTLVSPESEVVTDGLSERHRLVMLGVFFRRWTWTNTTIAIARIRRRRG